MPRSRRYYLSRVLVALTVPIMCYCLSRMIPAGLAGDAATLKRWFAVLAVTVVIGVGGFIVMTYTKTRLETPETSEPEVLSAAVNDLTRQQHAAQPQQSETPKEPRNRSSAAGGE